MIENEIHMITVDIEMNGTAEMMNLRVIITRTVTMETDEIMSGDRGSHMQMQHAMGEMMEIAGVLLSVIYKHHKTMMMYRFTNEYLYIEGSHDEMLPQEMINKKSKIFDAVYINWKIVNQNR